MIEWFSQHLLAVYMSCFVLSLGVAAMVIWGTTQVDRQDFTLKDVLLMLAICCTPLVNLIFSVFVIITALIEHSGSVVVFPKKQ